MNIIITAGGTGGHVFPALEIATKLKEQGHNVTWLGTRAGIEATLVPKNKFPLDYLTISGLRGKGVLAWIKMPLKLLIAIIQAYKIIKNRQADLIIGMGGFAAGPGGIASIFSKTKLIIHEQNAIPGLTNRILAHFADQVFCAFDNTFKSKLKAIVCGNPVRQNFATINQNTNFSNRSINLLIVGGSRGALIFNKIVPQALSLIPQEIKLEIWHQTGSATFDEALSAYKNLKTHKHKITQFIDDIEKAYDWADIILCRAGAMSVSEIAAAGKCAIFVPYPYAAGNHQFYNAQFLVKNNAAICIKQSDLSAGKLANTLLDLIHNPDKILEFANNARALGNTTATEIIVSKLKEITTP